MNREIKFRGKLVNSKEWAEGNLCIRVDGTYIITPDETILGKYGKVNKETVGQYTGLHDKNGKEIYEGDIIEWTTLSGKKYRFSVEYSNKYAQYVSVNTKDVSMEYEPLGDYENIEVIGNMYDNPELLGGE